MYWEFYEGGFQQAVRKGKWKAIFPGGNLEKGSLFDLDMDPGEEADLAKQRPEKLLELFQISFNEHQASPYFKRD